MRVSDAYIVRSVGQPKYLAHAGDESPIWNLLGRWMMLVAFLELLK